MACSSPQLVCERGGTGPLRPHHICPGAGLSCRQDAWVKQQHPHLPVPFHVLFSCIGKHLESQEAQSHPVAGGRCLIPRSQVPPRPNIPENRQCQELGSAQADEPSLLRRLQPLCHHRLHAFEPSPKEQKLCPPRQGNTSFLLASQAILTSGILLGDSQ